MTSNETPATQQPHADRARAAIDYADKIRAENGQSIDEGGMPQAAVLAQLAQAEATLAVAQAIHELTATIRDNSGGVTTW